MVAQGFAVIDFETTGLFPGRHDRVVEVAVVHTDLRGTVTGRWETLVNPRRDLGPQAIHGIHASEILDAPAFEDIAAQLIELLQDRVLVAHNASFDCRFLLAELERIGYTRWDTVPSLCTMQLAREFLPGSGRSLADCCDAYDIAIGEAHRASADALATARLLEAYILSSPMWEGWSEQFAADSHWPELDLPRGEWMPRPDASTGPQPHFLERITVKLPEYAGPVECNDYLALLDRALLDRHLSAHETRGLVELAETLGISRSTVHELHLEYFGAVATVAWADGVLTDSEASDLCAVADLLALDTAVVDSALEPPAEQAEQPGQAGFELQPSFELHEGDLVVLTGEMSRAREDWDRDLAFHGYTTWSAVTKKVKLLAAADPDSLSGKARKARDYGIPVVAESWLLERWPNCH
jgi:DNA polymerase-3 subunit epsilon